MTNKIGLNHINEVFSANDDIIIQENLHGVHASFTRKGDTIHCYSKNKELNERNTLRGFYNFVQSNIDIDMLEENEIIIGKWLKDNKFYVLDIYLTDTEEYAHYSLVDAVANSLGLETANRLYVGNYKSYEHVQEFIENKNVFIKNYDFKEGYGQQIFVTVKNN